MHVKICGLCSPTICEMIEGYFGSLIKEPFDHPINHTFKTVEYVATGEIGHFCGHDCSVRQRRANNHNWILG